MKQLNKPLEERADEKAWHYWVTWKLQNGELPVQEREKIVSYLKHHLMTLQSKMAEVVFQKDILSFKIQSQEELNMSKVNRVLQKQLIGRWDVCFDETQQHIISYYEGKAQNSQRLSKLIHSIREVDYFDLDEGLIEEDVERLKTYLNERQLGLIEIDAQMVLVDQVALNTKINLNCFECTKRHQYGCCCGSPCEMSEVNKTVLDQNLIAMEEALYQLDQKQYQIVMEKGGFLAANGSIKAFDGHCSFLIYHEGVYKCLPHKYALDNQLPIYSICPLSCLMYPLEIMELSGAKRKKILLVTAATEETFAAELSRWGSYKSLDVELRCIDETKHDTIFSKEAYQSVYEVNKNLLIYSFGSHITQEMGKILRIYR